MSGPRLQITPGMRAFLDYPKFRGPTRMLVLETGYFFDRTWARAGEDLGWAVETAPSAMVGNVSRDDIARLFEALGAFKPDFILTSNYAGIDVQGLFSQFFEDAKIPYVSWFTDTPRMILFGRRMHVSSYAVAATWERSFIPHFEALGFRHIHPMPLATDPALFNGEPAQSFARDVAFVGNSMIQLTAEALQKHERLPELKAAVERAILEGRVNRDTFAAGLDAIIDASLLEGLDDSQRRNLELLVNYQYTMLQRINLVETLRSVNVAVHGDPLWDRVIPGARPGVDYFTALPAFYRSTAVNVNNTSLQMKTTVNQRVFDCPAAGGFLITDAQPEIESLFDADEVVTYASLEELLDKTRYYLNQPDERAAIVRKARRRILAEHTHRHRLEGLEAFLRERFA